MQGGHYIHMSPLFTIVNRVYSNPHTVGSNPTLFVILYYHLISLDFPKDTD